MENIEALARLIGSNIRRIRNNNDLSQEELAYEISKTAQYLSLLENGKCCGSVDIYFTISVKLGVTFRDLLKETRGSVTSPAEQNDALTPFKDCSQYELFILKATLDTLRDAYLLL